MNKEMFNREVRLAVVQIELLAAKAELLGMHWANVRTLNSGEPPNFDINHFYQLRDNMQALEVKASALEYSPVETELAMKKA